MMAGKLTTYEVLTTCNFALLTEQKKDAAEEQEEERRVSADLSTVELTLMSPNMTSQQVRARISFVCYSHISALLSMECVWVCWCVCKFVCVFVPVAVCVCDSVLCVWVWGCVCVRVCVCMCLLCVLFIFVFTCLCGAHSHIWAQKNLLQPVAVECVSLYVCLYMWLFVFVIVLYVWCVCVRVCVCVACSVFFSFLCLLVCVGLTGTSVCRRIHSWLFRVSAVLENSSRKNLTVRLYFSNWLLPAPCWNGLCNHLSLVQGLNIQALVCRTFLSTLSMSVFG